jgi:hypothetical protein
MCADHSKRELPVGEELNQERARHIQTISSLLRGHLGILRNDRNRVPNLRMDPRVKPAGDAVHPGAGQAFS